MRMKQTGDKLLVQDSLYGYLNFVISSSLTTQVREYGQLEPPPAAHPRRRRGRVVDDALVARIRARVTAEKIISARQLAIELNVNRETVRRILRKILRFHPYRARYHQQLTDTDKQRRVRFCRRMLLLREVHPDLAARILFTDESQYRGGMQINRQNRRYWSRVNPCWVEERNKQRFKLNVWAGVLGDRVLGPCVLPDRNNGETYNHFLRNDLMHLLPPDRRRTWFMQDGAPMHTTRRNIRCIRRLFGRRVISLGTDFAWPPNSPDLNPMDFNLWAFSKERVAATAPRNIHELQDAMRQSFASVTPAHLQNCQREFWRRLELVIQNEGGLVEHLIH